MVGDQVHDLAFPPNPPLYGDHGGTEDNASLAFVERRPDHQVATPLSSSMVMNITPLAAPGF